MSDFGALGRSRLRSNGRSEMIQIKTKSSPEEKPNSSVPMVPVNSNQATEDWSTKGQSYIAPGAISTLRRHRLQSEGLSMSSSEEILIMHDDLDERPPRPEGSTRRHPAPQVRHA